MFLEYISRKPPPDSFTPKHHSHTSSSISYQTRPTSTIHRKIRLESPLPFIANQTRQFGSIHRYSGLVPFIANQTNQTSECSLSQNPTRLTSAVRSSLTRRSRQSGQEHSQVNSDEIDPLVLFVANQTSAMSWGYYYGEPDSEPAPVTFREAPFYNDAYYRRDFRLQYPADVDQGGGYLFPQERVFLRPQVDDAPGLVRLQDASVPWWHNPDQPHNGRSYSGYPVVEHSQPAEERRRTTVEVELYAPQLCCDNCERRVVECINNMAGVERVTADQWEKKVVVVGRDDLCPDHVLRCLQRDLHMPRSVFWHQR